MEHTSFRSSSSVVTLRLPPVLRLVFALAVTAYSFARFGWPAISTDQLVDSGILVPLLLSLAVTVVAVALAVRRLLLGRG